MGSSGGGPQRSGLLSLGAAAAAAAVAAARGRGSAGSCAAPWPRFAARATPAPEDDGTIHRRCQEATEIRAWRPKFALYYMPLLPAPVLKWRQPAEAQDESVF